MPHSNYFFLLTNKRLDNSQPVSQKIHSESVITPENGFMNNTGRKALIPL